MKQNRLDFNKIIKENKGIIFKICNMYCRNTEDQKDLIQDVILQLWNSFDKYDATYKLSTWIYRITLNVAISFYRKSLTHKKYFTGFSDSFLNIADDIHENTDERMNQLRHFINQLDEMNKALMILYLEDKTHEEIAEILQLSKSNVGTKINRIKQKLKNQIQQNKAL